MPASMMSTGHVASADRASGLIVFDVRQPALLRVKSVFATGRSGPVYNLTVDGAHEFYVNGVLVHNCDAMRYATTSLMRGANFEALGIAA